MDIRDIIAGLIVVIFVGYITGVLYLSMENRSLKKFLNGSNKKRKRSGPIWWLRK